MRRLQAAKPWHMNRAQRRERLRAAYAFRRREALWRDIARRLVAPVASFFDGFSDGMDLQVNSWS
jgi:hypothetical protein